MSKWGKSSVRCQCGRKLRQKYNSNRYACDSCDYGTCLQYSDYRKQCISCLQIRQSAYFTFKTYCACCSKNICNNCINTYNLKKCFRCGPDVIICKLCMTEITYKEQKYKVCLDHAKSRCNAKTQNSTKCKIDIAFNRKYCRIHRYYHLKKK